MTEYILIDHKDFNNLSIKLPNLIFITYDDVYNIISKNKHRVSKSLKFKDVVAIESSLLKDITIDKKISTKKVFVDII